MFQLYLFYFIIPCFILFHIFPGSANPKEINLNEASYMTVKSKIGNHSLLCTSEVDTYIDDEPLEAGKKHKLRNFVEIKSKSNGYQAMKKIYE